MSYRVHTENGAYKENHYRQKRGIISLRISEKSDNNTDQLETVHFIQSCSRFSGRWINQIPCRNPDRMGLWEKFLLLMMTK